jgi:hypothetical protein
MQVTTLGPSCEQTTSCPFLTVAYSFHSQCYTSLLSAATRGSSLTSARSIPSPNPSPFVPAPEYLAPYRCLPQNTPPLVVVLYKHPTPRCCPLQAPHPSSLSFTSTSPLVVVLYKHLTPRRSLLVTPRP